MLQGAFESAFPELAEGEIFWRNRFTGDGAELVLEKVHGNTYPIGGLDADNGDAGEGGVKAETREVVERGGDEQIAQHREGAPVAGQEIPDGIAIKGTALFLCKDALDNPAIGRGPGPGVVCAVVGVDEVECAQGAGEFAGVFRRRGDGAVLGSAGGFPGKPFGGGDSVVEYAAGQQRLVTWGVTTDLQDEADEFPFSCIS